MMLKRKVSFGLAAFSLIVVLTGCAGVSKADENELTVSLGARCTETFMEAMQEQFPDIHFVIDQSFSMNQSGYLQLALLNDATSDIYCYTNEVSAEDASEHLLDLSGYDFINNYDRSIMNSKLLNGRIYYIPGPLEIRCIVYNKTLFEEHGWTKPESFQELEALCRQIRSETDDIIPIAMSLGGLGYPFSIVTTFSQAGFLATPDGELWEDRFLKGKASIAEGWGEGLEITAKLIDAGAFEPEKYIGVWDGDAIHMDFADGKAAMFMLWGGQTALLSLMDTSPYEYDFFPFYGMEEGDIMLGATSHVCWGIPKRLGEPGNEKKLENALRVMEWFSTPEAQELMKYTVIDQDGNEIPSPAEIIPLNTEDTYEKTSPYLAELWEFDKRGNKMPMIYAGYESIVVDAGMIVQEAMLAGTSDGMIDLFVHTVDKEYGAYLAGDMTDSLGRAEETCSEEETAQLLANVLWESGLGDFALITHTGRADKGIYNKRGAAARLFRGEITDFNFNTILGEDKPVQILTLTGAQVKELLADGKRIVSSFDGSYAFGFPYYWSGIDVSLSRDGRVKSVKWQGKELTDRDTYRIVFCNGDYPAELVMEGNLSDSEKTLGDLWIDYLAAHDPVRRPVVLRRK